MVYLLKMVDLSMAMLNNQRVIILSHGFSQYPHWIPPNSNPQPTKNRGFSRQDLRLLGLVASIDPDRDGVKDLTG